MIKKLQREEAVKLLAEKMNISLEEAQKLYGTGEVISDGLTGLTAQQEAQEITETLHDLIEDNFTFASVDKKKFQNAFNKINEDNILEVLEEYKKRSGGETLSAAIMAEKTASGGGRAGAIKKIFNLLMAKIDKNKYDTSEVEYGFNRCISSGQLFVEPDSVDKIFDTMIAMAKGSSVSGKQDLDKTTKNAQTRNNEAAETVKTKAKSQGFISKALDKISGLWGGINQDDVEKIISEHDKELQELESLKNDPKAYAAKFKEIFGINYSKDAVENYNQINTQYKRTLLLTQQQQIFDSTFKEELETPNPGKITDEQYRKTYQKLSDMLGENVINTFLEQAGVEGKSTTEKYKILTNLIKEISEMNNKKTLEASGGKSLEELANGRTDAYHAAYGMKKDTLLKAQDWVEAQQSRLTTTMVGANILAMAGAVFTGGGSIALLSTAVMITDPVGFAERATDSDGMTKEDWQNFGSERLENLGWMALGMGVGKAAQSVAGYVKLKGLSHLMKNSGKSLDELLKNNNLPADLATKVKSVTRISESVGISTEVALDVVTTAMLQKDGVTQGDYLMSLAGALVGSNLARDLKNLPPDRQISTIQNTFKDFNLSKEDAMKILNSIKDSKFIEHVKNAKNKVQEWGFFVPNNNTGSKGSGTLNSGLNPEEMVKAGKTAYNLAKSAINKIKGGEAESLTPQERFQKASGDQANTANFKQFEKLMKKDPDMANALLDSMETMKSKIQNGEVPSKDMKQSVIDEMSKKYNIDGDDLADYLDTFMEDSDSWSTISYLFTKSENYVKQRSDELSDTIDEFRNMDKAEGAAGQTAEVKPQEETSPESHAANTETNNDTRIPAEKATQAENTKATDETQTAKEIKTSEEEFKISDELAEKYPDVANTNFYGGAETEKKTIELLENYENLVKNQKMDYENFDPSVIYRLISDHGIADNDMDRVFNIIKNRFHKDVIAEENRISGLKNQYKFSSEESITQSDNIINTIKEKQANGEKISIDDIEDMILDNLADQRDFEKIKKRIMEDPEIKNYINDNTHADILENPEYTDIYSERELKQATKILDDILAKVRGGEEFNKELIDNYEASGMVKEALEKMLANHWELGPKFKEIS